MFQTDQAIILRRIPYGEADQIVTFFSRDAGRLSGIARSSKRSLLRFGAALEPGSVLNLHYRKRPNASLVNLESADILISTLSITKSLPRICALSEALELSLAFLQEHQPEAQKFDVLQEFIESLIASEPTEDRSLLFLYQWLSLSGYSPMIDRCFTCHRSLDHELTWHFTTETAGLLCLPCSSMSQEKIPLSAEGQQVLRELVKGSGEVTKGAKEVHLYFTRYVEHLLGKRLKTYAFLESSERTVSSR
ncbi:MAG: DNA repair protein RecO [Deltaproteobacteria bacterium RIFCSPLOWO2_02_FULL_44_10]|nr:MAG: DNA repair protein RecO [Deltaproteobacteria bacterium RIFCSPHIGHO2_02_FULL_44_16]OGQ45714.1 MAG: DNA repair protein RecO [Deltaproteobacteria bacterium RIFCSPLOWO2_02_FULL_44_10]